MEIVDLKSAQIKKRRKRALTATELQEQIALVDWMKIKKIKHYAIPNGSWRTLIEAANLKRSGVSPGVPDICIPMPIEPYHGLYIELKRSGGGIVSPEQHEWLQWLSDSGYAARVCWGAEAAIKTIITYLDGRFNDGVKMLSS